MSEPLPVLDLDRSIVRHAAPTLAALKPANLFVCRETRPDTFEDDFSRALRCCRDRLDPYGVRIEVLARRRTGMLMYVYRPTLLVQALREERAAAFLADEGYDTASLGACIQRLHSRICGTDLASQLSGRCSFPHEIGLFLGYPYDDVVGFIENRGENFLCQGCWKVYACERDARECFCCYKNCTAAYVRLYGEGVPLECLAAVDENYPAFEAYREAG